MTEEKHIVLRRNWYDWTLEILSWLSLIYGMLPLWYYNKIPEATKFPIHYNHQGVNQWGDRNYIVYIIVFTIILFILLRIAEYWYKTFNYPVEITKNNKLSLYRVTVRLTRHVRLFSVLLFALWANYLSHIAMEDYTKHFRYLAIIIIIGFLSSIAFHIFRFYEER